MSEHHAAIRWRRDSESFAYDDYNRAHEWHFADAVRVPASAAPEFRGDADRVDPEAAFVAALSACHMLTFLAICARRRIVVDAYEDDAVGHLEKNADGRLAVTRVELRPRVTFAGDSPADEELARIHDMSHRECFIANSVLTDVRVAVP